MIFLSHKPILSIADIHNLGLLKKSDFNVTDKLHRFRRQLNGLVVRSGVNTLRTILLCSPYALFYLPETLSSIGSAVSISSGLRSMMWSRYYFIKEPAVCHNATRVLAFTCLLIRSAR